MIVYDPIYGRYDTPEFLNRLLATPEVRRLSEVRLLNTITPSLATLGEISRYSHTLGVLFLSMQNPLMGYSSDEVKALYASVLLHDAGTPAFAHLFEYSLSERFSWSHEAIIPSLLSGYHVSENLASQLFHGNARSYESECRKARINYDIVLEIVAKNHPLSELLFGSLDLDNLDNVARMSWALGLGVGCDFATQLARQLSISRSGRVELPESEGRAPVRHWMEARKAAYEVIVFDAPTVAAQAVLSDAIETMMKREDFLVDDWAKNDNQLLEYLEKHEITKNIIKNEYYGNLPQHIFTVQIEGNLKDLGFESRHAAQEVIEESVERHITRGRALGYVFVDNGAFSKRVEFYEPQTDKLWSAGERSKSVVFYGFCRSAPEIPPTAKQQVAEDFLEVVGSNCQSVLRIDAGLKK